MSKDNKPQGLSRILKLSLDAAFSLKTQPQTVAVRAQHNCVAEFAKGLASTNDPVTTMSKAEVEAVHVDFQGELKNADKQAGSICTRPVCKSGRGRGRKLTEKCSQPGFALQNDAFLASECFEGQSDCIHLQGNSDISAGAAMITDFPAAAAENDTAEAGCVDMELLELSSKDKQKMATQKEDICELPDLVKCQMLSENINSIPRKMELNTEMRKQEFASNSSTLEELVSNSSTLDCPASAYETIPAEHLLPSKTLISRTKISARENYPQRVEKQATKVSSPLVTEWKGEKAPDQAYFFRIKRTGQQYPGRNYDTKKDPLSSGLPEKHRQARPVQFLKQPVLYNHGGAYRESQRYVRPQLFNKHTQDIRFGVSHKETFRTLPHELNKEGRSGDRGVKQRQGVANKGKQERDASKGKQEGETSKVKQEGETSKVKQEGETSKVKQEGETSKVKQEGEISKAKQSGAASKANQLEYTSKAKQRGDGDKAKQEKGYVSKGSQQAAKQRDGDYGKAKQQERDHGKAKQQEGDQCKAKQQEGDQCKAKQQEGDHCKAKQQEGDQCKAKQQEGDQCKAKQQEGDQGKSKQEGDQGKAKQQEGDQGKGDGSILKQQEGVASEMNEQEAYSKRCKQDEASGGMSNHQEVNEGKASQHDVESSKVNQQKTDDTKNKQEINGNEYKQNLSKFRQSDHQEVDDGDSEQQVANDVKPKEQQVEASKTELLCYSKLEELATNNRCKQVGHNEANQQGGDEDKAKQHKRDDRKATTHKEDIRKYNQQEACCTAKHQKVYIANNEISTYFTTRSSSILSGNMESSENLESESSGVGHQVRDNSEILIIDTVTSGLCQDTSQMTERCGLTSLQNKRDTLFKNVENFSSETINSAKCDTSVNAGILGLQEPVLEVSSEFVGCNSSVHTMISAIYQGYEQETTQHDDKPAELSWSSLDMQDSTDVAFDSGETSSHVQDRCYLEYNISSAEKDMVAVDGASTAEGKIEIIYTGVQKGMDSNVYVYIGETETIKSASEKQIGDIVCVCKDEGDNGLVVCEQKKVIVCEDEGDNGLVVCEQKKVIVCEESASAANEKKEHIYVPASEQKEDIISVPQQQAEVKVWASKVTGETLGNFKDMLVNHMDNETVNINQDFENGPGFSSVTAQEISLLSCHASDNPSQCSADLPACIDYENSRSFETDPFQNLPKERPADHCTSRSQKIMPAHKIMLDQPKQADSNIPDASRPYSSCTFSRASGIYSGPTSFVYTSEEKENSSSFVPVFHSRELSLPANTVGSDEAMNSMITFLRSCSTNIQHYMGHYHENQPLDTTITVSLTHPLLPNYIPRLPHHHGNPYDRCSSSPPYPSPVYPYPGLVPAHPSCWNWWPWLERCPPNIATPIGSVPSPYTCYPPTVYPIPSEGNDAFPSEANYLPPSQSHGYSQEPASGRAQADHFCPKVYSQWKPAVFDRQQDLVRPHTFTADQPLSSRGCWTPEMAGNHPIVNTEVVDYSRARLQTSQNVVEEEIWNDGDSVASFGQFPAESVSLLNLHQKDYLFGCSRNENVPLCSYSVEETSKPDTDRQRWIRRNSVNSFLSRERLTNNWTCRMAPPAADLVRNENVDGYYGSVPPVSSDSQSSGRDAAVPFINSSSNLPFRSHGFEPKPHFQAQAARRNSAPYQMTKPWAAHHAQNRQRPSYPASRYSGMAENGQVVLESSFPSPLDVAAAKKGVRDWAVPFTARSRSYSCKFIDSHCHIDYLYSRLEVPWDTTFSKFQEQHAEMFPCNYEGCVAVFCNPSTFNADNPKDHILQTVSMEDGIWLAFGCHPKNATEFTDVHLRGLRQKLKHPKVVALGEIGLDYSGSFGQYSDIQKIVFRQQIQLALVLRLPLVIHCRDADDDCLEILTQMVPWDHKIHAHCFTRDIDMASRWLGHFPNLFLGLTPVITYKSAVDAIDTATSISLDRLLLETDAPFFVPSDLHKVVRHSYPGFALFTAEQVAHLRQISVDEVLRACRENTKKMYGI